MQPHVQHLVETRFSVWMRPGPPSFERGWLEERLALLRRICLPSLAAQTTEAFTCLLLCDEATPADVLATLREHERELPTLQLVLTSGRRPPLEAVRELVRTDAEVLITTRLDSDDAIAVGYLEAVQDYGAAFQRSRLSRMLVNFPRGYRFHNPTGTFYERHMWTSPFHSLFERPRQGEVATVFHTSESGLYRKSHGNHMMLHEYQLTHQDESMPAWLQVLHDGNVQNRVSPLDRECGAEPVLRDFALDLEA